jgi:zinc protease
MPHAGLGFAIGGYPAGGNPDTLLAEINRVLAEELKQGLSQDLIEASKRHEVASLEFQKDSVSGLANAWSQAVAVEGRQSPEDDVQAIRQVTVADVNRVARQYLDTNHAVVAILTPRPSGKPISEKTFGGKESFTVSEGNAVQLPDWAAQALARLELPHSTLHPTVTVLSNGLTLIVQPESSSDSVNVYGRIKCEASLEEAKGKEGVNELLGQLFSYGSKSLDRLAFQKALDDIAANESAGTDFSLQVLSEDFERGLELLAQNELNPALPPKDFPVAQGSLASEVAGRLKTPSYLQKRALRKAVYPPHDPSQRQATPGTIKSLKLEDVIRFHQDAFRPDLATIVVIGHITPERAAAAVNQYFGSWPARGPKPPTVPPAVPPNKPWTARVPDASRVQDDVTLAETVGVTLGQPDRYALELGNHVLGGGFYATRLYHDLREEGGLVYYVGSSLQFGESRSLYRVSYACDPPNVAKARAIIVSNLKAMQERDVTPDELTQAKGLLLREIPLSEASIDRVAQGWLDRAANGQPLDEPLRAARHYLDLTAPAVRAAFSQWLRPSDLVQITLGP